MPERTPSLRRWLAAALGTTAVAGSAPADDAPDVTLRYDGLAHRQPFAFKLNGKEHTRAVGVLGWQFPPAALTTVGFDHAPAAFCLEPLVPVTAGREYEFTHTPFGKPRDFAGLKDDKDGKAAAATRAKYVRELYARHYADAVGNDRVAAEAFQVAVWELTSEATAPVAPAGYSLYSGTFQAADPAATAPVFVTTAEGYLKELTGDDTAFATAPLLAGRELVRLDGAEVGTGVAAQAQLVLRNRGRGEQHGDTVRGRSDLVRRAGGRVEPARRAGQPLLPGRRRVRRRGWRRRGRRVGPAVGDRRYEHHQHLAPAHRDDHLPALRHRRDARRHEPDQPVAAAERAHRPAGAAGATAARRAPRVAPSRRAAGLPAARIAAPAARCAARIAAHAARPRTRARTGRGAAWGCRRRRVRRAAVAEEEGADTPPAGE